MRTKWFKHIAILNCSGPSPRSYALFKFSAYKLAFSVNSVKLQTLSFSKRHFLTFGETGSLNEQIRAKLYLNKLTRAQNPKWDCEAAGLLEAPKPWKNQSRRKIGQK